MNVKKVSLFIVGAAKAGTTSLYYYLNQHPEAYMCPIKEPNFFGSDINWSHFRDDFKKSTYLNEQEYFSKSKLESLHIAFISSLNNYELLFQEVKARKIIGEASTSYLYSRNAAQEIKQYNPEAKIIIILRDPVDRLISHYKMDFVGGSQKEKNIAIGVKKDFEAENKGYGISNLYVELSLYYEQIKRYLNEFGQSQVLLLDFEKLVKQPEKLMKDVCYFLGIDVNFRFYQEIQNKTRIESEFFSHLKFLKNLVPSKIVEKLKSYDKIFYTDKIPVKINRLDKEYIQLLLKEDWIKTQSIIYT